MKDHPNDAAGYIYPFCSARSLIHGLPAAFLAIAPIALAASVARLAGMAWLFVLLSALYLGTDLSEDALFAKLLLSPDAITADIVRTAYALTKLKIWTVSLSIAQLVILALATLL